MDDMKLGQSLWIMHLEHMRTLDQIVEASRIRGESGALLYLYHVGRPVFPGELTEKLGLTTGRIANILRELERSGLIVRTPDALDRRRVLVALTPAGETEAAEQNQKAIDFHMRMLSQLSEDEAQQVLGMLRRMVSVVESDAAGAPRH